MPDKMWMKKNYNPKNFAGMLLRIKIGRMKLYLPAVRIISWGNRFQD